jgi:DNA-binding NtrC family response regulator
MTEPAEQSVRELISPDLMSKEPMPKQSDAATPDAKVAGAKPADKVMPAALDALSRALTSAGHRNLRCEEFVGMTAVVNSSAMARLFAVAARVADSTHPVLITGESGVGKELVARAVHQYSLRSAGPFVDVNCAALPEHLMESELFGHEKGAFSGADSMRPGLFESANGGTMFLDEIGELDSRMQAKLLRVLDGQSFFRLGGSRKVKCDVRVIAATNIALEDAVKTGRFRRDLFHRLDALHMRVPALRDRIEDIEPLCRWFLRDTGYSLNAEAIGYLEAYSWPGNVRELRNALNKAMLFAEGKVILAGDLPIEIVMGPPSEHEPAYSLGNLEQRTIHQALEQTGGHQQKAADLLGISRRTLIRKLKSYRQSEDPRPRALT